MKITPWIKPARGPLAGHTWSKHGARALDRGLFLNRSIGSHKAVRRYERMCNSVPTQNGRRAYANLLEWFSSVEISAAADRLDR
jgi:hypothetical protein